MKDAKSTKVNSDKNDVFEKCNPKTVTNCEVSTVEERLAALEKFAKEATDEISRLRAELDFTKSETQYAIDKAYEFRDSLEFPPIV